MKKRTSEFLRWLDDNSWKYIYSAAIVWECYKGDYKLAVGFGVVFALFYMNRRLRYR